MSFRSTCWFLGMAMGSAIGAAVSLTFALGANSASAQITPDATLPNNSTVTINGSTFNITGGTQAGRNLFHSFKEFSVPTGGSANFNNALDVQNIIGRVTGGSVSNIDGLIRTLGTANLFLLNPAGIIFGPNARLDVGGSFVGTTADAIQFGNQGFFSATNPNNPALLTVNPSALFFNQIAAALIQNNSVLSVQNGRSLLLVGGDIKMDGGRLNAFGGRVELGGLASAGTVGLNGDGNNLILSFANSVERSDVLLSNGAGVDVTAGDGGSIAINARNLDILGFFSFLGAGITGGLGNAGAKAGDITLNATGNIKLDGSYIYNYVEPQATGNGGNINIATGTLSLTNGAQVDSSTSGLGNAGSLNINASDSVVLSGTSSEGVYPSGLFTSSSSGATGAAGSLTINTPTLQVRDGAKVSTRTLGEGSAGNITIAANTTSLDGAKSAVSNTSGARLPPTVSVKLNEQKRPVATVEPPQQTDFPNARGNSGDINIRTGSLSVTNGARLDTSTSARGNAGNIFITTIGNAIFSGTDTSGTSSGAFSTVQKGASGNGGVITINTADKLTVDNGAQLVTSTLGNGDAGNIRIDGKEVLFNGVSGSTPSGAFSAVASGGVGKGGNVNVRTTGSLSVTNGAQLSATTDTGGQGNAGTIDITTKRLNIVNGAQGTVSNSGSGNAGNLQVKADSIVLNNQGKLTADSKTDFGGNTNLRVKDILLMNGESLISNTSGTAQAGGFGGNFTLSTKFLVAPSNKNNDIITNAFNGRGGNIFIIAEKIYGFVVRSRSELERLFNTTDINLINPRQLPTNDIVAISQGNPFLFTFNTVDPSNGLVSLPVDVFDLSKQITQGCSAFDQANASDFQVAGRGGLPPSPDETLSSDAVWEDTRLTATTPQRLDSKTTATKPKSESDTVEIIPATGWVFNGKGEVTLVSHTPNATAENLAASSQSCRFR